MPAKLRRQRGLDGGAMQLHVAGRVDHHRSADEDGRCVMLDRVDDVAALHPVSAGRETDEQLVRQALMNGGLGARRHHAGRRQQRSVKVDRDQLVGVPRVHLFGPP